MPEFVSGLDLCESFFTEVAQPILNSTFPTLRYSAGLIGYGSDVLGFDDEMSTDHMWGPRFYLFLPEPDFDHLKPKIAAAFSSGLPYQYKEYSTHFGEPDWTDNGTRLPEDIHQGPVNSLVEIHTLRSYFETYLGLIPYDEISVPQWLTFTEHRLLGVTSGRVFHDDLGLTNIREKLSYFPQDIWLWMMASQWKMIAEEEPFVGRGAYAGDDIGSRIVAARQVQRVMRLCFLQEKRYAPYSKWFGSAFRKLVIAPQMHPLLEGVLQASHWKEREGYLSLAYTLAADRHNDLNLTEKLSSQTRNFFGRPFKVLFADRFADALKAKIQNEELRSLPLIGSVSQFTDSTTLFDDVGLYNRLQSLYR